MRAALLELPGAEQLEEMLGAWQSANPPFAAMLRAGKSIPDTLARFGLKLCRENRPADGVEFFRAALALNQNNSAYWTSLAGAFNQLASFEEAAYCLERSLALGNQQSPTWLLLGSVKAKVADFGAAEAAYREALRLEPDSAVAWQCLGLVKQERGELADAIDCFESCVARGCRDAGTLANLGRLRYQLGRFADAVSAYSEAVELDPENSHFKEILGRARLICHVLEGCSLPRAFASYRQTLPANAQVNALDLNVMLEGVFKMLSGFGHSATAVRFAEQWLELLPESASAAYLLQAASASNEIRRSPPGYIVEYFDSFAEEFDNKLVNTLRYEVPAKLIAEAKRILKPGCKLSILDMGCGTGLCGPLFRPIAHDLIGVDLSSKMLERARQRGVYDALFCEDLLTFLGSSPNRFELAVAADVLLYFGDLRPVWAAAARALILGGLLVFSTELLPTDGYKLKESGRFAHSTSYVRSTAAALFEEVSCSETTLRQEALAPVKGNCFVFRRR
jgi:predicted TPR repeat methyltransferase